MVPRCLHGDQFVNIFFRLPEVLRAAYLVGFIMLVSPVLGVPLELLSSEYNINSNTAYLSFAPGVFVYFLGLHLLVDKKGRGFFILYFGWLMNSWCIYPFLDDQGKSLHLPGFVFLSILGLILIVILALNKDFRVWFKSSESV
ncbi:hypothetical protein [Marinobacter fonticola]|uniref:hypothetical protein n=1 Tax=Marinobacter fonticola TaxID=2603215 RepID=UPI0011E783BC|nr:hypothetical protein [Marinobacter fonticola]